MLARIQAANNRHIAMIASPTKTNIKYFSKVTLDVDLPHMFTACTANNMIITTCNEIDLSIKQSDDSSSLNGMFNTGMCNYQKNNNAAQNGEYGISIIFDEPTETKINSSFPVYNTQHTFYDDVTGKPLIRNLVLKARAAKLEEVRRCDI